MRSRRHLETLVVLALGLLLGGALLWVRHVPTDTRELVEALMNPFGQQQAYDALLAHWAELYGQKGTRGSVQRVIEARTPSSGTVYVILASLGREEWSTVMLYLVREDGSLIEPWDMSGFGTRESFTVLDVNGDGWQEIVGSHTEALPTGAYHDRLYVCRIDDPPVPIFQLSFNRTGEVVGGRASWRVREDEVEPRHHIELYRRDWKGEEHVVVAFAWDPSSEAFVPIADTGEVKWYIVPVVPAPEGASPRPDAGEDLLKR